MRKMRITQAPTEHFNETGRRLLSLAAPLILLGVCGCNEPVETLPPIGDSYYALSVITFGPDGTLEGTIKFATSLEAGAEVDEELTLESTGPVPLYRAESPDKLLNSLGKSGEIAKFALTEEGIVQDGEKIGFSAFAIYEFRAPVIHVASKTKAYL